MSWDIPVSFDAFERAGVWWLPEDHEDRVAGSVSFDPRDGVRLETIGAFRRSWQGPATAEEPFTPGVVLGSWGPSSTPITLYRTARIGPVPAPAQPPSSSTLHARCMIVGHHFRSVEDVAFASLRTGFTDLEEWAGHRPFGLEPPGATRYVPMDPVAADVGALGARLTVESSLAQGGDGLRTLRLDHRVLFGIEPEERRPLRWYREVLGGLQDLLTLLVGRPVYPRSAEAQVHHGASARSGVFFEGGLRSPASQGNEPPEGLTRPSDVLVDLPAIRPNLPEVLDNYFAKRELLAPVFELFFGALFNPRTYPDFQFLSLAQALETYHRRAGPEALYMPEDEYLEERYPEILSSLPNSLPKPFREKLKPTLKYANEWSLRKRLKDLVGAVPVTGIAGDDPAFVERVVDTRNYLTHYTEELEQKAWRGHELMGAVEELRRLLAFLLLRELGLDVGTITAVISTKIPRSTYLPLQD